MKLLALHQLRAVVCCCLVGACLPVDNVAAQQGIGPRIQALFEQTKQAKAEADFAAIIRECEALRTETQKADRVAYLTKLQAWALNKRGEVYAGQAALAENPSHAAELDELALRDFEVSVNMDATRWKALHNRGVSYALQGRHDAAEADFSAAVKENPEYANSWFNRAEIRLEAGRHAEAISDYTQVLELTPKDLGALRGRGRSRALMGDWEPAIADFTRALELARSDSQDSPTPEIGRVELLVDRGLAYQQARQWERAAVDFRAALEGDEAKLDARTLRAAAWLMAVCPDQRIRNPQLAVQKAQLAIAKERQEGEVSAESYDTLAAALASAGNPTKAAQVAEQALELAGRLPANERQAIERRLRLYREGKSYRIAAR
ncbi:MAG: tetratricopeptide repeat protein [Planctomycetales bacterium]|nr:tetratricopeptide repeat protein [Planctomycetales bacterium]